MKVLIICLESCAKTIYYRVFCCILCYFLKFVKSRIFDDFFLPRIFSGHFPFDFPGQSGRQSDRQSGRNSTNGNSISQCIELICVNE